jgi:hypothetical protein
MSVTTERETVSVPHITPQMVFTHPSRLDLDFQPGPGQRYTDGPHVTCVVTSVRGGVVRYRYASSPSTRGVFIADATTVAAIVAANPDN